MILGISRSTETIRRFEISITVRPFGIKHRIASRMLFRLQRSFRIAAVIDYHAHHGTLTPRFGRLTVLVRAVGVEPTRRCHRGILSPLRLPVPTRPLWSRDQLLSAFPSAMELGRTERNAVPCFSAGAAKMSAVWRQDHASIQYFGQACSRKASIRSRVAALRNRKIVGLPRGA